MDISYEKIEKGVLNQSEGTILKQLIALSNEWELEKTSPSYTANDMEYYAGKEVFAAFDDSKVIGYAVGEIKNLHEETSYNKIGEKAFELDELFVSKPYRDMKVGRELFRYMEASLNSRVDLIGVNATSFRYEDLLRFYINELGLSFNHALLVKRM